MSGFPYQNEIDVYYEKKKKEVSEWLIEYTNGLKRITKAQKEKLLSYSERISFSVAGEVNMYVQQLPTVSKRDKAKLETYLQHVDWLPENITTGILDGKIVSRVLPSPLERLFGDREWKSKKE